MKTKRPLVITLLSLWIFLSALVDLFYGALLFVSTDIIEKPPDVRIAIERERAADALLNDQVFTAAEGLVYMALGVLQLALGVGFWRLKRWAWVGIMTLQALSLLLDLTGMSTGDRPTLSLVFSIVLVFLLNQSNVRQIFGVRVSRNEPDYVHASISTFDSN